MLKPLYPFCALSVAASVLLSLLPQGSLRKTAAMVAGLLAMLCWAESFLALLKWSGDQSTPISILSQTSYMLDQLPAEDAT